MKTFTLLLLPLFAGSFQTNDQGPAKASFYYFCQSTPRPWGKIVGKQNILYTDVVQIECEEAYFKTLAADWGATVDKNCKNENGCTSDLNYYPSLSQAKTQFDNLLKRYTDTAIYNAQKIILSISRPQEK